MKELIWKFLPASFRRAWSGQSSAKSGWFGNYPDWKSASDDASGYDADVILNKVREAVRKVNRGEAAFERDSVVFGVLDHDPSVMKWLKQIGKENNNELRVIDFGGSLGSTYFQYRNSLGDVKVTAWTVIEQSHFVEAGKAEFQNEVLRFANDASSVRDANVLLLFSVLPYLEKPFELLQHLLALNVDYVIIDRTAIIKTKNDRITLQIVPESIYKASYPAWFFAEQHLLDVLKEKYVILDEFRSKFAGSYRLEDGTNAVWMGYVLKRK